MKHATHPLNATATSMVGYAKGLLARVGLAAATAGQTRNPDGGHGQSLNTGNHQGIPAGGVAGQVDPAALEQAKTAGRTEALQEAAATLGDINNLCMLAGHPEVLGALIEYRGFDVDGARETLLDYKAALGDSNPIRSGTSSTYISNPGVNYLLQDAARRASQYAAERAASATAEQQPEHKEGEAATTAGECQPVQ
ncbi:hypothetical protein [Desulfurivibrio alkaliphilus]|uniref:Uncharacterized protein n=1 Tax=Desulfurivibrio alkaliphilus (strain DSM 19089 / UNIQEM U267 / AHT2) TaxID=589865 RepID=D6Z5J1_DESAT|nr:hypothetical protein [Desulfurivibrio alkaliphilus]ADH86728.1 hypothetical protein DaAHT2_2054 [Desulfurivibrio alkaliphilus AHT 2]